MILYKFFLILKILIRSKYIFVRPPKKPLVIFDGINLADLKKTISAFDYFVLEVRFQRINEIYLNPIVIYHTIKNLSYNIGLYSSYLLALLDTVGPKVVFTFIDNSYKFSQFANLRSTNHNFIALQNGVRYEHMISYELFKKKIIKKRLKFNIPLFLCFGEHDVVNYKKYKMRIGNFTKVGSLKLSNFLSQKKKNIKNKKQKNYDILLISDVFCWDTEINDLNLPIENGVATLIKHSINFAIKYKLNFKLATRFHKNNFDIEKNFYRKHLSNIEYRFLLKNLIFRKKKRKIYSYLMKSKLVIGTMSTVLKENLSLSGKTLACNFTKTNIFDFPIKGICFLKNSEFNYFEKRAKYILKITKKKYFQNIDKPPQFLLDNTRESTIDLVKLNISNYLNV
jgi:surface carbohydrate biosynthesis protein